MDDAALVRTIVEGDAKAFRVVVLRYERPLFRFLARFGFAAAAREDLAQETFLRAFRALASFDAARGSLASWLFTIARNVAATERAQTRHQCEAVEADGAPDARSAGDGPAELHERANAVARLRRALDGLPAALHSTFVLVEIRDLSLKEVAAIEGCAVGTVKSRVHRAREQLRAALGATERSPRRALRRRKSLLVAKRSMIASGTTRSAARNAAPSPPIARRSTRRSLSSSRACPKASPIV